MYSLGTTIVDRQIGVLSLILRWEAPRVVPLCGYTRNPSPNARMRLLSTRIGGSTIVLWGTKIHTRQLDAIVASTSIG